MNRLEKLRVTCNQIQEDIITYCDGMDTDVIDNLCQIVVDNFERLDSFNEVDFPQKNQ
jgi:hypothetical protein